MYAVRAMKTINNAIIKIYVSEINYILQLLGIVVQAVVVV